MIGKWIIEKVRVRRIRGYFDNRPGSEGSSNNKSGPTVIYEIGELFNRRGKTPQGFAEKYGIDPDEAKRLVAGGFTNLRSSTIASICEFCDCEPGDFIKLRKCG